MAKRLLTELPTITYHERPECLERSTLNWNRLSQTRHWGALRIIDSYRLVFAHNFWKLLGGQRLPNSKNGFKQQVEEKIQVRQNQKNEQTLQRSTEEVPKIANGLW